MEKSPLTLKFWLISLAYWIVVAAILVAVFNMWPGVAQSSTFFYASTVGIIAGGLAVLYVLRAKS